MDALKRIGTADPPELLLLGALLLVGYFVHALGRLSHVPRVTLLLILGVVAGPSVLDVIPHTLAEWFPHVTHLALAMVGFLLGESFAGRDIKQSGRTVLFVSIGETLGAALVVFLATFLVTGNLAIALLLAGIAPASAPAATLDVIRENHARGPLSQTVLGVVAIDDAWGVIIFSFLLVIAEGVSGGGTPWSEITSGLWEIGGATIVGIACGLPMAWLTGRVKKGEPTLLEAAGFVFICGGIALWLDVSYLFACMVLGATVANVAKHHTRPFREIEGATDPFLVMFFLLAGYELDLSQLKTLGLLGVAYFFARSAGLILGGNFAAQMADAPAVVKKRIGWCLLPQAGVALGLALLVEDHFPELSGTVLSLTIGSTVVFEIVGPLVTRWHLHKAGEI